MPIITISRGSLSSGQDLAERVASQLGCSCMSREMLLEAATRYGVPEPKLSELFEKKPSFWGRIRGGMERQNLSREEAAKFIQRIDDERYHRMRELFEVDWRDPALYDVVLNLEQMSLDTAAEIVVSLAQKPEFQPTAASNKALQDVAVGARVKATLLADPTTGDIPVQVDADDGVVHISGIVTAIDDGQIEDTLRERAMTVPGVSQVLLDIQFRPVLAHPG